MSEKKSNKPTTASGINLKSYYGENQPGQYPYTSGIYSKMYQEKLTGDPCVRCPPLEIYFIIYQIKINL